MQDGSLKLIEWEYYCMIEVVNTGITDLEHIFSLFDESIAYQEKHGYPVWKNYDRKSIIKDIEDKNHYKVIVDAEMAMVFSVAYSDKIIWRHMDEGDAIYLHRIVVNPSFKGKRLFGNILEWSIEHCKQKGLRHVRMDTWAANPTIINYYKTFGFKFVENYTTPNAEELPVHNRSLALTLLEYTIRERGNEC